MNLVQGEGRLDGSNAIIVSTAKGGTDFDRIEADTLVISVGATPRVLPTAVPDGERILTWTQLYDLPEIPEHLIVVGSGVTGAEFASAYRALGAKVTLISSRDQVLPGEDADAASVIEKVFKRNGMKVMNKSRADSVVRDGDSVVATLTDGREVRGSHCLMAVGSVPNTADIGLEEAGVQLSESRPHPGQPRRPHVDAEHLRGRRLHDVPAARVGRVDAGPHRRLPRAWATSSTRPRSATSPRTSSPSPRSRRSAGRRRTSRRASCPGWSTSCRSRRTRARR